MSLPKSASTVLPSMSEAEACPPHVHDYDSKENEQVQEDMRDRQDPPTILRGKRLVVVFTAFCMSFFLVALDQTILSTALPTLVSYFNAVDDITWIASAYYLPLAAFTLFFGKLLAVLPAKVVFMASVFLFELGSLLCAVSFSVEFLIFGRAVAGLGGTGIWASIMSIIARITTLETRPMLLGLFSGVYAISSIVGPILGGAFSDHVTWRWCFYINLPVGGLALVLVFFFLPNLRVLGDGGKSWKALLYLDWIGAILNFGFVTFLLIALQYGGNERPWNDGMVIAFLVLAAVLAIAFFTWERHARSRAVLSYEILVRQDVFSSTSSSAFIYMSFTIFNYYLPLLYQVKGHSATHSGIDILPFMISAVITTIVTGGIVAKTGFAWPILISVPILACVGFGVLFTADQHTSFGALFGYQLLVGIGLGGAVSLPLLVSQAEFADREDLIPQATSLVTFGQLIGSSIGLAISSAVFASQLKKGVSELDLSPQEVALVLSNIKAISGLPQSARLGVVNIYIASVQRVFLIGVPATALALMLSLLLTRKRLHKTPGTM